MKFGFGSKKALSGAELYVRIFQLSSLLPLVYIFIAAGSLSVVTKKGVLSFLFDLGVSLLPRWESMGLSLLYHKTGRELAVYFVTLGVALAFGLAAKKIFCGGAKKAFVSRIVFLVIIGADLILRLVPFGFIGSFGVVVTVIAFAVRVVCFVLILLDIIAEKKKKEE